MRENFAEQGWNEYLIKLDNLRPMNDKKWKYFSNLLRLHSQNPNYEFLAYFEPEKDPEIDQCYYKDKKQRFLDLKFVFCIVTPSLIIIFIVLIYSILNYPYWIEIFYQK